MDARLRDDLRAIFDAGVAAALPDRAIEAAMRRDGDALVLAGVSHPLAGRRVRVLGAGKAAIAMARAVERVVGERVSGLVVVPHGVPAGLGAVEVRYGAHPVPDRDGMHSAQALAAVADGCEPGDLVVGVWSGGGSALLALPCPGLSLDDLRAATAELLRSGLPIERVNAVRRRLGALSGGRLGERLAGIDAVHLWLSDVPGDELATIASGPVVPDPTVTADLRATLPRWAAVLGPDGARAVPAAHHVVIANVTTAVEAAAAAATALGYRVGVLPRLVGEARVVGRTLPLPGPGEALVAGGETTVTVRGAGRGGRCQELALAYALARPGAAFGLLAAGTDGRDGPTDAAGALADGTTASRAREPAAALADNDAYRVFAELGDLVITGPTGTNVTDLVVILGD